jgi:hypothetical protein
MRKVLRAATVFALWGVICTFGMILSMIYNIYAGGLFITICFLVWLELEKKIETWWDEVE